MFKKISGYLERRKKVKLYQQWVKQAGLPPEEIPPEVLLGQAAEDTDLAKGDVTQEETPDYSAPIKIDRGMVRLPFRYVLRGLLIIALLIAALTAVSTILIMRAC